MKSAALISLVFTAFVLVTVQCVELSDILASTTAIRLNITLTNGSPSSFIFTEGPVYSPTDKLLYFSDTYASKIYKIDTTTTSPIAYVAQTNTEQNNGLKFDSSDALIGCRASARSLTSTSRYSGKVEVLADNYNGEKFNGPTDLTIRSDGTIYFTDPPFGILPEDREMNYVGVFRLHPDLDNEVELLLDNFNTSNGIVFSPDESYLYICDYFANVINRYAMDSNGDIVGTDLAFIAAPQPDGIAIDVNGNLYVTSDTGLRVYTPNGTLIGEIVVGNPRPTNIAFGDDDRKGIYVTSFDGIYKVQGKIAGKPTNGVNLPPPPPVSECPCSLTKKCCGGQVCCSAAQKCCGTHCCGPAQKCCGDTCCSATSQCCGTTCCALGKHCVAGQCQA